MLQITFLALGLSGLLFAIAYFFKKYQRGILWAAALILFIGTSLMLGLGLIKVVENGEANHLAKKMFGDYGIYCDGKIFGLICLCKADRGGAFAAEERGTAPTV
jgi:hypothetical protein